MRARAAADAEKSDGEMVAPVSAGAGRNEQMLTMRKNERTPGQDQNGAQLSTHPPARPRFHFIDDEAIQRLPPPEWQIEDLLPAHGLAVGYAPPEHAKTFF